MSCYHKPSVFLIASVFALLCSSGEPLPENRLSPVDLAALREIKNSLTEIPTATSAEFFSTWDFTSPDPCSNFSGLICSSSSSAPRRVISLTLGSGLSGSPGLAGSLSPSISNLTELLQLVLFSGIVTGPIPPQLSALKNLRVISMTNNRLTGPIPESVCALSNLHTLDLSYNQLTGPLPECMGTLINLRVLVVDSNRLTGRLPLRFPVGLYHLDLRRNGFFGVLPGRMPSTLRYLSVSENELWGPLNGLEPLLELVYLDVSVNRLSGPIPPSLFRPTLSSMLLQRNNLSGGVPPHPVSWSHDARYGVGSIVDLSHNGLTGSLTTIFVGVESLFLNHNHFSGTVPEDYVQCLSEGTTKTLYLQHNYFSGFPLRSKLSLPDSVTLCLSYNCLSSPPQAGLAACPNGTGQRLSRPAYQCNNGSNFMG